MKSFVIFGTNAFSELLKESIEWVEPNIKVEGFTVDDSFYKEDVFCELPIWKYSELSKKITSDIEILVSVGYTDMNDHRKRIFSQLNKDGYKIASYIDPESIVRTKDLGTGNIVLAGSYIGIKCKIGDGNIFFNNSSLSHHCIINNFNFFAPNVSIAGCVKIGNNCFFGNNSCTRDNIFISDYSLIGAGTYINNDIKINNKVFVPKRCINLNKNSKEICKSF